MPESELTQTRRSKQGSKRRLNEACRGAVVLTQGLSLMGGKIPASPAADDNRLEVRRVQHPVRRVRGGDRCNTASAAGDVAFSTAGYGRRVSAWTTTAGPTQADHTAGSSREPNTAKASRPMRLERYMAASARRTSSSGSTVSAAALKATPRLAVTTNS